MKYPIILASSSPRRKDIMDRIGIPYSIVVSEYEEDMSLDLPPEELIQFLAKGKAQEVSERFPNAIVISADTIVEHNGKIFGKPKTEKEALEFLTEFNNTTHHIRTGYAISHKDSGILHTNFSDIEITFKNNPKEDLLEYLNTKDPMDKAGGYSFQGFGAKLIEKTSGNVDGGMGLPIDLILEDIKRLGLM